MEQEIRQKLLHYLPGHEQFVEEHLMKPFCLSDDTLYKVRDIQDTQISQAYRPETRDLTPLKLWPSCVTNRLETIVDGTYLALDLGGSNLRVMSVTIKGTSTTSEMTSDVIPKTILRGSGVQLFDFIAEKLYGFAKNNNLLNASHQLPLGFTFSFPVEQKAINVAILQSWTKEFVCRDVIGQDVGKMMQDAIEKHAGLNVRCVAIINDTVGTLIAGGFIDRSCTVGLICGTGTNGCCFETQDSLGIKLDGYDQSTRVAVDTQWNNFGNDGAIDFSRSKYDFDVSEQSTHPHQAQLEKMMSGMFAGETIRHVILKLNKDGVCFNKLSSEIQEKDRFTSEMMSTIVSDTTDDLASTGDVLGSLGLGHATEVDRHVIHLVCKLATSRAASLVATCLACLLNRVNLPENGIAVDGSFYRGNQLLADMCHQKLASLINPGIKYHFVPCRDGSGLGAALVAAMQPPS